MTAGGWCCRLWCCWLWCSCLWACAAAAQDGSVYRIGPQDKIEVRVDEIPDMQGQELDITENGTVEIPHVGAIRAQGRTERQLADDIRQRLEEAGMRRATVSIRVTRFSRPVALLGAVVAPGNRSISGRATLLDVLLEAGGPTDDHGPVALVRRRASNGLSDQVEISLHELLEIGDPVVNIPVFSGDVIRVPKAPSVEVSFLGEVRTTGSQTFRGNRPVTLLAAIARAGGLSDAASNKIRILRGQGSEKQEIVVHYRRILNGVDPDVELRDGDIIVVRESFF